VVGRLVIDEREAVFMRENVFRTVIAVAQSVLRRQQPVDQRLDGVGDFGAALLNAAIERLDAQLYKYRVIGEAFDKLRISSGGFVNAAEDAAGVFADSEIDLARQQLLFPHLCPARRVRHGEDVVLAVSEQHLRDRVRRQQRR